MNRLLDFFSFAFFAVVLSTAQSDTIQSFHETTLWDDDGFVNQIFGQSVAIDGDMTVIAGKDSVFTYVWEGGQWIEKPEIAVPYAASPRHYSIALSGDTLMIGDGYGGTVFIYSWTDSGWWSAQRLGGSDSDRYNKFGTAVVVSADTAVIGAPRSLSTGAAYVFVRDADTGLWVEQQELTASDGVDSDRFGWSVALDGQTIVVGAPSEYNQAPDYNLGAVYVFAFNNAIGEWVEHAKLASTQREFQDQFGNAVAVSGDSVLVGAYMDDGVYNPPLTGADQTGSAYVFVWNGSTWEEEQRLTASDYSPDDLFGGSVDIEGDIAVIGAHKHKHDSTQYLDGAAYVFARTNGSWTEQTELLAADRGATYPEDLAYSVGLSGDTIVAGAIWDYGQVDVSGTAHVFRLDIPEVDTDGDGVPDAEDGCPADANKIGPGTCGCGVADTDTDGDGTADCNDQCPNDADKVEPGTCGCGVADTDSDGDGTADCNDNCPADANKVEPGTCGCGVADIDSDGDGTADCNDNCPNTANANQIDTDGDGIGDVCEPLVDEDGDGVSDDADVCPHTPSSSLVDDQGCSIAQYCPCDSPMGTTDPWKNHGKYVSCVANASEALIESGLISEDEKDYIVSSAARSDCGHKGKRRGRFTR